ncbi:PAS domain S-box protein [Methylobacterium sp. E-065]|uniref:PAS domain S-box protein n=1 Tax=Methylobacterium sp. E-065 TaxID=2836583 RepID=UPI001FBAD4AA|nr:PAS domain S-box protein [Methylobacterium sp. E-065]MCJ2018255.1 PAS domain S-box protein [Methylobacterium sp. E-065]
MTQTHLGWPRGDEEMAAHIRAFDWAATPLGPSAAWSERLRVMVEQVLASPLVSSLVCGPERVLIYNAAAAKLFGARHPTALGRPLPETFPDGWATVAPFYERAFAGEAVQVAGQPLDTRGEGEAADVFDAVLTPVCEADEQVAFVHMTGFEIGARLRVEAALRASDARHRLLIDSWAQATWETAAAGFVVTDSPSWRAYTGQNQEQWLGYGWLNAIHPDDRAYAERQWREAVAVHGLVNAEFRLRAPDGGWRMTNVRAAPVLDQRGSVENWVGMNIDIGERKQAEEALRQSEGRLQLALEATGLAVYEWDLVSDHLTTNERFRELMDIAPDETVIGARIMENCVHLDDRPCVDPGLVRAMDSASDGKFVFEHRLSRLGPLGHPWVLSHGQVYFAGSDDARRPVRVFGTLQDITERKQAEIAARESEERQAFLLKLSDAFRAMTDPEAIGDLATRLVAEQFKVERSYICRYAHEEGLGWIGPEYRSSELRALSGEYRIADFPEGMKRLETGPLIISDLLSDASLSETDRRSMSEMLGLRAMLAAVLRKGENNAIWCLVAPTTQPHDWTDGELKFLEDVAERTWAAMKRAQTEVALRASDERFRQFANASAAGLWIRDADTLAMDFVSPAMATIYGVEPDALLGEVTRWAALIVPEDRDVALGHLKKALTGDVAVHEFRIQQPADGSFRWLRNTDFPLYDMNSRVQRIGGITQDVTEAKLATEHTAVLLAELQHRVRNIMAMIRSITARTGERAASVTEYTALMAGRLLTLARVQTLLTRAANAGVGITGIVQDELDAQAHHEGQFTIEGPDLILSPKAAEVLTLAVHELTTNALKYGGLSVPDGHVTVRWVTFEKRGTSWLGFDWAETGAPERPPPDPSMPRRRGFGSELIEERIPYELGGRGKVVIEPGGAHCHLEFALRDGASILETDAPQRANVFGGALDMTDEADLGGHRVLVVEDDFYLATDAARALRGAGAEVLGPCPNEEAARDELAEQRPDAAVIDINLGLGPSFKLAETLKNQGIPFVFTTGYDLEVIPAEFDGVERLQKPIQLRQIVAAIAKLVNKAP